MSEVYGNTDIEHLVQEMKEQIKKKNEMFRDMKLVDNRINQLEKMIYTICKHDWKKDSVQGGDSTEYICTQCGLYK